MSKIGRDFDELENVCSKSTYKLKQKSSVPIKQNKSMQQNQPAAQHKP